MNISQDVRPVRAHGKVQLELADGRTATLELDFDLSSPSAHWGVEYDYPDRSGKFRLTSPPERPIGQTLSIYLPISQPDPLFTITVPNPSEA